MRTARGTAASFSSKPYFLNASDKDANGDAGRSPGRVQNFRELIVVGKTAASCSSLRDNDELTQNRNAHHEPMLGSWLAFRFCKESVEQSREKVPEEKREESTAKRGEAEEDCCR